MPFLLNDLGAEAGDFSPRDSALYDRLARAGLVTFGRTATPEGGIGVATEAAVYGGPTRNPRDLDRTPGGSWRRGSYRRCTGPTEAGRSASRPPAAGSSG